MGRVWDWMWVCVWVRRVIKEFVDGDDCLREDNEDIA